MYLTNLYYKVDLEHCIAVVNEQGRVVGYLKVALHIIHGMLRLPASLQSDFIVFCRMRIVVINWSNDLFGLYLRLMISVCDAGRLISEFVIYMDSDLCGDQR